MTNDKTQRSSLESSLKPMPLTRTIGLITVQCAGFVQGYRRVLKSANYFNLRLFSYRSKDRLNRRNAKSTQSIRPQTFAVYEPVSYPALLCPVVSRPAISCPAFSRPAISCPAISCPANWSVIFTSSVFSHPKLIRTQQMVTVSTPGRGAIKSTRST